MRTEGTERGEKMSADIEREISYFEEIARVCREYGMKEYAEWNEQMGSWLKELKSARETLGELTHEYIQKCKENEKLRKELGCPKCNYSRRTMLKMQNKVDELCQTSEELQEVISDAVRNGCQSK